MPPEENQNRPLSGRPVRPRGRAYVQSNYGRADYAPRPVEARPPVAPQEPTAQPIPQPEITQPEPVQTPPPIVATPAPAILDFTPPLKEKAKRKIKLRKPSFVVSHPVKIFVVVIAVCMAITGGIYWRSNQATDTELVLREALTNALMTKQLHAEISGAKTASIDYDLSDLRNPIVSSKETVAISGIPTAVSGYGTVKDTYISYTELPPSLPKAITQVVSNNWVHMRNNNAPAVGAPNALARTANPRYHVFGLALHGNLAEAPRKEIVNYMIGRIIYDYVGTTPKTVEIDGKKAVRFDIKPNVGELRVANQSLATQMQLNAEDIQDVIADIDRYQGADVSLYVGAKSKQIERIEITKKGQKTTIVYSEFNSAQTASEPQTNLTWQTFAPTQFQFAAQLAAKQKPQVLDVQRKNNLNTLKSALQQYYILTNSYPSLSNLNDQIWIAANLPGVDPEALRDPLNNVQIVVPSPRGSIISYQPLPVGGRGMCANTGESSCASYKLISVLSDGQQYIVQGP